MKHLTLFQNRSEFDAFKNDEFFELPNVSFIVDENKVIYSYFNGIIMKDGNYYPEIAAELKKIGSNYLELLNSTDNIIYIDITSSVAGDYNNNTVPLLQSDIDYIKSINWSAWGQLYEIQEIYFNFSHNYVDYDYARLGNAGEFNLSNGYFHTSTPM